MTTLVRTTWRSQTGGGQRTQKEPRREPGSTKKGGTRMNSASVAHRPVETPQESVPKKGPWAVGHESDERIAIIADALNLFDDGRSRSDADTAIRTQVATRAYVKSRFDGPYAHADAVARHRAVAAAQAKAADYRESLSEADRHLVMLIALRSLDTYHESLEGFHGPPGGDTRTWQAMDAARQSVVRADLEHAWYHREAHLQNVAYQVALDEMGHGAPEAGCIVRLPKVQTDPVFEVVASPPRDELFPSFLAVLAVWRWWHAGEVEYQTRRGAA